MSSAGQSPGLVQRAALTGGVAGPLVDRGAGRGRDAADVEALAAVPGDHLVVVRVVAAVRDLAQGELLVPGAAEAGPLVHDGAVGGGHPADVEALAGLPVDDRVRVGDPGDRPERPLLLVSALA